MTRHSLTSVLLATSLSFMVLYLPQPLLPLLAREFAVSDASSWLLMSVPMLPLGLAPIFYGYLMQGIAVHQVLRASVSALAISTLALALPTNFDAMLGAAHRSGPAITRGVHFTHDILQHRGAPPDACGAQLASTLRRAS